MSKGEFTTIPTIRNIYYSTYANFPAAGMTVGDCAYATDRRVFYRWSGAAWDELTIYCHFGAAADIPVLPSLPNGSLYHATDTDILYMVQSGVWVALPGAGYGELTLLGFQFNPATGTFSQTPFNINSNDETARAEADTITQYAEVILPAALQITQFRHYGHANNNNDGAWKIEYKNVGGGWVDWVTGIVTRGASWSNWDSTGGTVVAIGIRLVCTTVDTGGGTVSTCGELEVIF